jgi:hypothetical protein
MKVKMKVKTSAPAELAAGVEVPAALSRDSQGRALSLTSSLSLSNLWDASFRFVSTSANKVTLVRGPFAPQDNIVEKGRKWTFSALRRTIKNLLYLLTRDKTHCPEQEQLHNCPYPERENSICSYTVQKFCFSNSWQLQDFCLFQILTVLKKSICPRRRLHHGLNGTFIYIYLIRRPAARPRMKGDVFNHNVFIRSAQTSKYIYSN